MSGSKEESHFYFFCSVKSDLWLRSFGWHNIAIDLGYTLFYLGVSQ